MLRAFTFRKRGKTWTFQHWQHTIRWACPSCYTDTIIPTCTASLRALSSATPGNVRPYLDGNEQTTHFGFKQVPVAAKEDHVRTVFENVADSYDVMNDLMSGGLHRAWKDYLLQVSKVETIASVVRRLQRERPNALHVAAEAHEQQFKILDVAGGTGDVAFRFVEAAGCIERAKSSGLDPISITVCDINTEMLRVGEFRATQQYGRNVMDSSRALCFQEGNAQDLYQFEDNTFDIYTIAFGLRNVTDVDMALKEACRVLKPGGRFMCLEFSQVPNEYLRGNYTSTHTRIYV
jgi:2-methoxy-6-polyprenyl-1,4-benzoquinol methylase